MKEAKMFNVCEKGLLSIPEMMEYLGVGYNTALELLHTGPFCVRIGRRVFANRAKLDEWLSEKSGIYSCVENAL